jgi:hypothetical protein
VKINIQVAEMRRAIKYVLDGLSGMAIGTHARLCSDGQVFVKRLGEDEQSTTIDKLSIELEIMRPKSVGSTLEQAELEALRQVHLEAIMLIAESCKRSVSVGIVGVRIENNGDCRLIRDDGAFMEMTAEQFAIQSAALVLGMRAAHGE